MKSRPVRYAVRPSTEPTDRSTLRVMITTAWPTASSSRIDGVSSRSRQPSWLNRKRRALDRGHGDDEQQHEQDRRARASGATVVTSALAAASAGSGSTSSSVRRLLGVRRACGSSRGPRVARVAACMTASGVASSRAMSAVIRPSHTTSTRSAMPSTSGSSEEIIRIARPWPASSESSRCTSALVPTSMPRVGSSMISSVGSVASHLAMTTFCWLPPLMVRGVHVERAGLHLEPAGPRAGGARSRRPR